MRIYSNELDKENTLLIAEGFSFADEHILEITQRALRNPTLELIIFCYEKDALEGYVNKFNQYNNVDVVYCKNKKNDFKLFNRILKSILPEELPKAGGLVADEVSENA